MQLPTALHNETELDELLSRPSPLVLETAQRLESDLLILGVGGKMGPTLARMAARALAEVGSPHRVIGVARFSQPALPAQLTAWGVTPLACDLLDRQTLATLPDCRHVIFMAGQKFGTSGQSARTWAMNSYMPALVAERFTQANVVVFSTGNVYPLTPVAQGGSLESDTPNPVGEYAMSCLGRERIFEHFALTQGLRCAIMRLNYAIDLRYGVLLDIAQRVYSGQPIDLSMGNANVIWQGDANAQALALLDHCSTPPFVLNVTGPETVSVRRVAEVMGRLLAQEPHFVGQEAPTALLSNAAKAQQLFGYPSVSLQQMIEWTVAWVKNERVVWNKPTHFEARDGKF
ncbi:MAG: NAD-dependent epimerase/dehydratase family protein [Caldilineaceae bacterium]